MRVGICRLELFVPESRSLKDKRQVIRSLIDNLRNRFNVSAAEVDYLDSWGRAAVGLACVSNDSAFNMRVLNKVVDFVEENPRVVLQNYEIETV
ncbi:MAG: DUF503 domain-containing protein [Armatimonadota bacterium]